MYDTNPDLFALLYHIAGMHKIAIPKLGDMDQAFQAIINANKRTKFDDICHDPINDLIDTISLVKVLPLLILALVMLCALAWMTWEVM